MHTVEFYHAEYKFVRISEKKAKTAYKNGLTVIAAKENIRPFNSWAHGYLEMNIQYDKNDLEMFDNNVDSLWNGKMNVFRYYNGKNVWFYIPVINNNFDDKPEYNYGWMAGRGLTV